MADEKETPLDRSVVGYLQAVRRANRISAKSVRATELALRWVNLRLNADETPNKVKDKLATAWLAAAPKLQAHLDRIHGQIEEQGRKDDRPPPPRAPTALKLLDQSRKLLEGPAAPEPRVPDVIDRPAKKTG